MDIMSCQIQLLQSIFDSMKLPLYLIVDPSATLQSIYFYWPWYYLQQGMQRIALLKQSCQQVLVMDISEMNCERYEFILKPLIISLQSVILHLIDFFCQPETKLQLEFQDIWEEMKNIYFELLHKFQVRHRIARRHRVHEKFIQWINRIKSKEIVFTKTTLRRIVKRRRYSSEYEKSSEYDEEGQQHERHNSEKSLENRPFFMSQVRPPRQLINLPLHSIELSEEQHTILEQYKVLQVLPPIDDARRWRSIEIQMIDQELKGGKSYPKTRRSLTAKKEKSNERRTQSTKKAHESKDL